MSAAPIADAVGAMFDRGALPFFVRCRQPGPRFGDLFYWDSVVRGYVSADGEATAPAFLVREHWGRLWTDAEASAAA
jgi:hypothetical protein